MIAEGNETPQDPRGEPPAGPQGPEGRGRRGEGDPLAERRARRAAEAPEHLLTLRAEAAEATVRTLESHLAIVQQRLHDAEAETRRLQEELVAEASSRERGGETSARTGILERELQRAHRREQAEHRARVEAEDRERDERAEIDGLARRLDANERYVRALAAQLQELERRLARAEESAERREAAEREELHARVAEVERSAVEIGHGLERERAERERAERVLASIRRGQRRVEGIVRELGTIVSRLRAQASSAPPPPPATPEALPGASELAARSASMRRASAPAPCAPTSTPGAPAPTAPAPAPGAPAPTAPTPGAPAPMSQGRPPGARELAPRDRSGELESALAAAVERLRARAEDGAAQPPAPLESVSRGAAATAPTWPEERVGATQPPAAVADAKAVRRLATQPTSAPPAPRRAATAAPPAGRADEPAATTTPRAPAHKHSLSLIGRLRRARKQRRERR